MATLNSSITGDKPLSSENRGAALLMLEEIQTKVERMGSIAMAAKIAEEKGTDETDCHSINLFAAIYEISECAKAYQSLKGLIESIPSPKGEAAQ